MTETDPTRRSSPPRILRGAAWCRVALIFGTAAFLLLVLIPGVLWVLGGGEPTVSVDYVAKINRRAAAVLPDDRALPIYLELVPELSDFRGDGYRAMLDDAAPGNNAMDRLAELIGVNTGVIDRIREAAAKPGLGYVIGLDNERAYEQAFGNEAGAWTDEEEQTEPRWLLNALLPQIGSARSMARVLSGDTRVAAMAGDGDRALDNLDAQLSLAEHADEHGFLIGQMTTFLIESSAIEDLAWVLDMSPNTFDDSHLAAADAMLREMQDAGPRVIDYSVERDMFSDTIQRMYTDDGRGNGHLTTRGRAVADEVKGEYSWPAGGPHVARMRTGFVRLVAADRRTAIETVDEMFARLETDAARPRREWSGRPKSKELERLEFGYLDSEWDFGMRALALLEPAADRASRSADRVTAQIDAVLLRIALERYRRDHRGWPESVERLSPAYLDPLPMDPFGGGPLRFTASPAGITVYSTGTDRDDDRGRTAHYTNYWYLPAEGRRRAAEIPDFYDGDWVLLEPLEVNADDDE